LVHLLGVPTVIGHPLSERRISRTVQVSIVVGLLASLAMLGIMLATGTRHVMIELGNWVKIEHPHYHFSIKLLFDRLSVPFVILTFVLCGTVGAFANRYMHRERGFNRFFVFYSFFVLGMVVTSLAGTIETLFAGWELVGLSSALLVGFYIERPAPVRNGLHVWSVYRIADAALLLAAITMHHLSGEGDFDALLGTGPWPGGVASVTPGQAFSVGLLLLVAAAGKSALVPFSGWLPRAMEGPTPSSAVFYGALSVHLGAFLLLRVSPLLALSPILCCAVVAVGLVTAGFAAVTERVQTDIKCALSFASLTQVGIIVAEIGFFAQLSPLLLYVPLLHLLGHGCLRTLQFVRAPSLLLDYRSMENAIGTALPRANGPWERWIPPQRRAWFYRFALQRGYLDACLVDYIVAPLLRAFRWCDAMERRWGEILDNKSADNSQPGASHAKNDLV
jgi:NADH:ubiquinone oxidoreductase subunit 5 (subunit L)/multisubunit Na+/H+ antiporter MnhA subunit